MCNALELLELINLFVDFKERWIMVSCISREIYQKFLVFLSFRGICHGFTDTSDVNSSTFWNI